MWTIALTFVVSGCAHRPVGWAPPVGFTQEGTASWYGPGFHGRRTANGERFDQEALTAAHRKWAFGTRVRVTLRSTGRSVIVTINDRIPRRDRIIDVSRGAARALGLIGPGIGKVDLEVVGQATARARSGFTSRSARGGLGGAAAGRAVARHKQHPPAQ